jgi:hypothetical protein
MTEQRLTEQLQLVFTSADEDESSAAARVLVLTLIH